MKQFKNLKIGAKLTVGFAIVSLIATIIGVFGIIMIQQSSHQGELMYTGNTKPVAALEQVAVYFQRTRVNMLRIVLSTNPDEQQKYLDRLNGFQKTVDAAMKDYAITHSNDAQYIKLQSELPKYIQVRQAVIDLAMAGKQQEAYQYSLDHEIDAAGVVNTILDTMFTDNVTQAAAISDSNTKSADIVLIISIALVVLGIGSSVVISIVTTRAIVTPTKKLITAAERLSAGDVTISVKADSKDELGALMTAFATMIDNIRAQAQVVEKIAGGDMTVIVPIRSDKDLLGQKLREMVRHNNELLVNISGSSQQVTAGAENVANSSMSLAQGATEQASAIEELEATVEDIVDRTKHNAGKAGEATKLSSEAMTAAVGGRGHVQEMLKSMDDIRASSESIAKIISVIDGIAFQTNILALNAAVEAARAGEHGKGFAIVASEVKTLADKSARAAKEVADIILGSTAKVTQGQDIAKVAAASLNTVTAEISRVADLITEISMASSEQAEGLMQIKAAIGQVSTVIINNTSLTESTAAASEELSGQACILLELVEEYKLDESHNQSFLTA